MRRVKRHTVRKFEYLRKYITAYLKATQKLSRKFYVDAFAGTGKCVLCGESSCKSKGGKRCLKCGRGEVISGSALIALEVDGLFDKYIFVELLKRNVKELQEYVNKNIAGEKSQRIEPVQGDFNEFSRELPLNVSAYTGCLIFLDPEGPELFWSTIENLAAIKKSDLLLLYPYDMALVRLTKDYKEKLDKFYGGKDWQEIYYSDSKPENKKEKLLHYYIQKLQTLGYRVTPKQIRKGLRDGKPLYHLIFASRHYAGHKIMDDIFNKELDGQTKLKL